MANPTGPFEIDVRTTNNNGQDVIAEVTLRRNYDFTGNPVENEWEKEEQIPTGSTVFTFSNLPAGVYEAFVRYKPTEENENTINPSDTVQVFSSLDTHPIDMITHTLEGSDISGKTLWGEVNQSIGETGVHSRNIAINLEYSWYTDSSNFPINYLGQDQHRISYKLNSGEVTSNLSDTVLDVGQDKAKISLLPYDNTGELDFRGCMIRLEPSENPDGPWEGTFEVEMELEVYNPQKEEWSAYEGRIRTILEATFYFNVV